jgi:hypothetical protein
MADGAEPGSIIAPRLGFARAQGSLMSGFVRLMRAEARARHAFPHATAALALTIVGCCVLLASLGLALVAALVRHGMLADATAVVALLGATGAVVGLALFRQQLRLSRDRARRHGARLSWLDHDVPRGRLPVSMRGAARWPMRPFRHLY